eukprot:m.13520 g.13520  ORF g.13520 m.13520 type:complete len:77 (-) comp10173_c0_seq1:67-297(-)
MVFRGRPLTSSSEAALGGIVSVTTTAQMTATEHSMAMVNRELRQRDGCMMSHSVRVLLCFELAHLFNTSKECIKWL